jgi:uncharacterized protein (TIGR00297 family)
VLDRWVNIFFTLAVVFVFILFGNSHDHVQIFIGFILAFLFSAIAFILNWLTKDGATSATIFGSMAYGLAGLPGAAVVLAFFLSGSLLSKDIMSGDGFLEKKYRRDGKQVWANSFWFALWILIWFIAGVEGFMIAAVTSIAAANSDTWATEIGNNRVKGKTWLIDSHKPVQPGTHGGISFYGTVAAFGGALFISVLFWGFDPTHSFITLTVISVSAFLGCLLDSYLGARFQDKKFTFNGLSLLGVNQMMIDNNTMNWISAGSASLISLILILIIGV